MLLMQSGPGSIAPPQEVVAHAILAAEAQLEQVGCVTKVDRRHSRNARGMPD
jgi:hypothetical protein